MNSANVRWLPSALALLIAAGGIPWCAARSGAEALEVAPGRPLVEGDGLTWRVADSPAIGVGVFESSYDTTVERGLGSGTARFTIGRFRAERWLRGGLRRGTLRVSWFEDDTVVPDDATSRPGWRSAGLATSGNGRVIAFFRDMMDVPLAPRRTFLGALQRVSRWAGGSGGHDEGPSVLTWTPDQEGTVRLEVASQRPDALLARAEVIVVVEPARRPPLPDVRVREVLRGRGIGRSLDVRFVLAALAFERDPRLLLLARARDGVLEPLSLEAGVVKVEGTRVPAWNCTLDEVRAGIARDDARRAH